MINQAFYILEKPPYFCSENRPSIMTKQRLLNYIPKADGGASILLYGDVGAWGDITAERVATELLALEGQYSDIDVHINSVGGDVFTGIAIYNALRASKANIRIYIDGLAASIAGVIALCGKPLYMSQYARLMLHKVSGGAYGSASELRETAELIEGLEDSLAEMIAGRIKMSKEEVHAKYFADGKDHWITAREALSLGIIDGIHDLPEESDLSDKSTTDDIYKVFNNRLSREATKQSIDMTLLDQIKTVQGFADVTEATLINRLSSQATKIESLEQAINTLREENEGYKTRELENILDIAIADGRITNEQKPNFLRLLKADREGTEAILNGLPKAKPQTGGYPSAKQFTSPSDSASSYEGKTWAELHKSGVLAKYKAEDPDGFARAFKAEYGVDYQF